MTAGTLEIAPNELVPGSDTALTDTFTEATRFLKALDPDSDATWTFQTIDDTGSGDQQLVRILHGDLEDHIDTLLELNARGAGVFVCVSETNQGGRETKDITRVRAVFIDLDGAPLKPVLDCGVEPHIIVETSNAHWHAHWRVTDCALDQFSTIQRALAQRFEGDLKVTDLPRVMRIPGFTHRKNPDRLFVSRIYNEVSTPPYTIADLTHRLGLNVDGKPQDPEPFWLPDRIPVGSRNSTLFAYGRSLKAKDCSRQDIANAIDDANTKRCEDPLPPDELKTIVKNAWSQPDRTDFLGLVAATNGNATASNASPGSTSGSGSQTQADKIIEALGEIELFNDGGDGHYASFYVEGHFETHVLESKRFESYCQRRYYKAYKGSVSDQALKATIGLCKARATFDGVTRLVGMRVVESNGTIWLDLCNEAWQVVEITSTGWQVRNAHEVDVRFWRPKYAQELPFPLRGAPLSAFRDLFNTDAAGWALIQAALLGMLRPSMPQPVLALYGHQGSGKSFAGGMVRRILDPNASDLRAEPHDTRDIGAALKNNFIVGIDNVSYLSSAISDALCRLTSGAGFAARELYTDADERLVVARRPVILTAIEEVITRGDLMDRAFVVRLRSIPQEERKTDEDLQETFAAARPKVLGALLNAAVIALKNLAAVKKTNLALPRLADLARWATAAESALDLPQGKTFLDICHEEHARSSASVVEGDVITDPLRRLIDAKGKWSGFPAQLLEELRSRAADEVQRSRNWPKNPRALTGRFDRLAPDLEAAGITLKMGTPDRKSRRWIEIRRAVEESDTERPRETSATPATPAVTSADGQDGLLALRQELLIRGSARADVAGVADVVREHSALVSPFSLKAGEVELSFGDADGYYLLDEDNLGRRGSETSEPTTPMNIPDFSQELF